MFDVTGVVDTAISSITAVAVAYLIRGGAKRDTTLSEIKDAANGTLTKLLGEKTADALELGGLRADAATAAALGAIPPPPKGTP